MNATRLIWSKTLECCILRQTPEVVFLICTAVIGFLPLLFYITVRFCGPIRDLPNVLKGKYVYIEKFQTLIKKCLIFNCFNIWLHNMLL